MSPLIVRDGKILIVSGKLAAGTDCCCCVCKPGKIQFSSVPTAGQYSVAISDADKDYYRLQNGNTVFMWMDVPITYPGGPGSFHLLVEGTDFYIEYSNGTSGGPDVFVLAVKNGCSGGTSGWWETLQDPEYAFFTYSGCQNFWQGGGYGIFPDDPTVGYTRLGWQLSSCVNSTTSTTNAFPQCYEGDCTHIENDPCGWTASLHPLEPREGINGILFAFYADPTTQTIYLGVRYAGLEDLPCGSGVKRKDMTINTTVLNEYQSINQSGEIPKFKVGIKDAPCGGNLPSYGQNLINKTYICNKILTMEELDCIAELGPDGDPSECICDDSD